VGNNKPERQFQAGLIKELKTRFDGCMVFKLDPDYIQGSPDLLVLHGDRWATLECKRDAEAETRPNQEYYVQTMDKMSFSRFVSPENKEEVLRDLQRSFESGRRARIPRGK
jgi:hypothetical protein